MSWIRAQFTIHDLQRLLFKLATNGKLAAALSSKSGGIIFRN